ncbi:MAG: efflux RND transporter periplasmic adaptor subunit [Pseudomonadota bacterium]
MAEHKFPLLAAIRQIGMAVALIVLTIGLAACSNSDTAEQTGEPEEAPGVSVITVSKKPFADSIEFIGQTEAFQQVDLRARVTGFLVDKTFEDGSIVEKDEELFVIDPAEYEVALSAAQAGLSKAEADLLKWQQQLERTSTLVKDGTVAKASLDDAVAAEATARANISEAQAEIKNAELNVGYTHIKSPISGRIGKAQIDVGNLIGPDSGVLATVVALDPLRVVFSVSEKTYLTVQKEQVDGRDPNFVPQIRFANGDLYDHPGELLFVDNQVDNTTGTIRVFLKFPNPEGTLLPGLFVTVILSSETPVEQILIPVSAVQLNQSGPFVLLVDGESKVETRPIQTGDRNAGEIVVTSGLEPGETIIVDGIQKVRPGMTVAATPAVQSE